ncbi:hypothetical protein AD948_00090 [Acetobacter senegalensis]|uniref:Uncharacterized protein n=1 Tax=Acetobacter senegalensis TaxID=446692 RepID=A0A149U9H3_9PROT|nr:hypothetical protein AD948_00090 [Acetobacter senegalensis]
MSHSSSHHTREGITEKDPKPEGFSNPPPLISATSNSLRSRDWQLETRKNRVISGEAGWLDDVEVAGRTKGIIRTDFHDTRR